VNSWPRTKLGALGNGKIQPCSWNVRPSRCLADNRRSALNLTLCIQPKIDRKTGLSNGYPYGVIPRLVLFWIVTEASRLALGMSAAASFIQCGGQFAADWRWHTQQSAAVSVRIGREVEA